MRKERNSFFTNLAFEQAKINLGSTGKNPSVGCIIEKNGTVLSSGFTSYKGRPHAEFNALNKNQSFKNANAYLTLEPCSHYGITPPCVNIIIKKKIKNVFFPINDVDTRTAHKAKKILKRKKINVIRQKNNKYAKKFYESYLLYKKFGKPLLDAKIAISNDFYTKSKDKEFITNIHSIKRVHLLRSFYDCILSTSKSINDDNSILNCRINGLRKNSPAVIIIDRNFKLKKNLKIFKKNNKKIYLFISVENKTKEYFFKKKGVKIIKYTSINEVNDYIKIFARLSKIGFSRIFVEAGLKFTNYLIKNKFLNNIYVFKSKEKLNKKGIRTAKINILKKIKLKHKVKVNLFGDMLYKIKL